MSNETPADQFISDNAPQADTEGYAPMIGSADKIPAPIDPNALPDMRANGDSSASFEDLSFADVFSLMLWHPVQTASLLVETLSRPGNTPVLNSPAREGLSAVSLAG